MRCARLLPLAVLFLPLPLAAATLIVNSTADAVDATPGNGVCATAGGVCTLRAAIMEANVLPGGPHTINVQTGLYVLTIPGTGEDAGATGDLDINAPMTIAGAGAAVTIVDGGGLDRVFNIGPQGDAHLTGLTIRNGAAVAAGQPPSGYSSNFTGGALYASGTLSLVDCVVAGSRANAGGGIFSSGTFTMDRSTVRDNVAEDLNFTNAEGGGLLLQGAPATITNSTLSGNRARNGGGIHVQGSTVTLTNSTLSGNTGSGAGAIDSTNGTLTLTHVTIANNAGSPGGLRHFSFDGTLKVTFRNTLLSGNANASCEGVPASTLVSTGGNVDSGTSCGFAAPADRSNASPRLGPLESNGGPTFTHALLSGSDAIDLVTAGCAATDQRGVARPKGSGCDSGAYERDPAGTFTSVRTIPILIDVTGGTGAHFTSEMTLANRGTTTASVQLTYTAAPSLGASGSGIAAETLAPGQELAVADALAYLRGKGVPIPASGNQGGSLRAVFAGLSSADAAYAGARTSAFSGPGRAGLAYPGVSPEAGSTGRVHLFGLRDSAADRTNLALVNIGTGGAIGLKVTLVSGTAGDARTFVLPVVVLSPGQWTQINAPQLLRAAGFANAWAIVEPVSGTDPFFAYAVFNDNQTDDGSYVPAVSAVRASSDQVLPVLVESDTFESELVLANPSDATIHVQLTFELSLGSYSGGTNFETETLGPREQKILPSAIQYLRTRGIGVDARGPGKTFVGILRAAFTTLAGGTTGGFIGARTASPAASGGQYGLFYTGLTALESASGEAWVYGLLQDSANRSNLAVLNAGFDTIGVRVDVYDAATGSLAGGDDLSLGSGRWQQINGVLTSFSLTNGYARVTRTSGNGRFIAYGVVNDGPVPNSRTNDGSYVAMTVVR
jgi:CSLREA domain-containing protein